MLTYQSGLNSSFESEAIKDALPIGQNSPQKPHFGLYTEQFSASPFTMPRHKNIRTWMYRLHPSAKMPKFTEQLVNPHLKTAPLTNVTPPNPMRWDPVKPGEGKTDFIDGLHTFAANGDVSSMTGAAIHIYSANQSMERFFYNADGEMLIVPQKGGLLIKTELGHLTVEPLEFAVIPRGIKFQVLLLNDTAYGYICENYGAPFQLPDLGPMGSNGSASVRDFLIPVAAFEDISDEFTIICKFEGQLWHTKISHSPLDVVAWHGNLYPYKYNLRYFHAMGSISADHPDPSIFTLLTSPSDTLGMANVDFVIFPPRWMVSENTFRPPWFHRNVMSEFMGLIEGVYDAKPQGFSPGGATLHNRMVPHGPDQQACEQAMNDTLKPTYFKNSMAFMFESSKTWRVTEFALGDESLQGNYNDCWLGIAKLFEG